MPTSVEIHSFGVDRAALTPTVQLFTSAGVASGAVLNATNRGLGDYSALVVYPEGFTAGYTAWTPGNGDPVEYEEFNPPPTVSSIVTQVVQTITVSSSDGDAQGSNFGTIQLVKGVHNRLTFVVVDAAGGDPPDLNTWTGKALKLKRNIYDADDDAVAIYTVGAGMTVDAETANQLEVIIPPADLASLSSRFPTMLYGSLTGTSTYAYRTHHGLFEVQPSA
jgi:hypothetical protein